MYEKNTLETAFAWTDSQMLEQMGAGVYLGILAFVPALVAALSFFRTDFGRFGGLLAVAALITFAVIFKAQFSPDETGGIQGFVPLRGSLEIGYWLSLVASIVLTAICWVKHIACKSYDSCKRDMTLGTMETILVREDDSEGDFVIRGDEQ